MSERIILELCNLLQAIEFLSAFEIELTKIINKHEMAVFLDTIIVVVSASFKHITEDVFSRCTRISQNDDRSSWSSPVLI